MRFTQYLNLFVAVFCFASGIVFSSALNIGLGFLNLFLAFNGLEYLFNLFVNNDSKKEEKKTEDNFFDNFEDKNG